MFTRVTCCLISVALSMFPLGISTSVLRSRSASGAAGSYDGLEAPIVNIHVPEDSMGMLEKKEEQVAHEVQAKALSSLEKSINEFDQMVNDFVAVVKSNTLLKE